MQEKKIIKKIGTHSGSFHTDEALATAMLCNFTSQFANYEVIRTRDLSILEKLDIIVDVGGKYDPFNHRYDHHQKEFQDTFNEQSNIRLSSAGLIYKHFGREVLLNAVKYLCETEKNFNMCAEMMLKKMQQDQKLFEIAYQNLYDSFIKSVDASDNGVNQYDGLEAKFPIHTNLQNRVSRLNPGWNIMPGKQMPDDQFKKAMEICKLEFLDQVRAVVFDNLPGRPIVEEALNNRLKVSKLGTIIYLQPFCPWRDHLLDLEEELKLSQKIQFVIFQESSNSFRVQAVPVVKGSFSLRTPLKAEWRGVSDNEKLKSISQIQDIVFCHANGFIGGAQSLESCIKMAEISLQQTQ